MSRAADDSGAAPEVAYIVSSGLIAASDALPSNLGRSNLVHSLIYHLGLLELRPSDVLDDVQSPASSSASVETDSGSSDQDEISTLIKMLTDSDEPPTGGNSDAAVPLQPRKRAKARIIAPFKASQTELMAYHSGEYISALLSSPKAESAGIRHSKQSSSQCEGEEYGLVDDCPRFVGLEEYVRLIAGGAITAARALSGPEAADIAIFWDGGRHHAHRSRAAGFCYVNDVVLAIMELMKPRRVLVDYANAATTKVDSDSAPADDVDHQSLSEEAPRSSFHGDHGDEEGEGLAKQHLSKPAKRCREAKPHQSQPSSKRRTMLQRLESVLYLDLDIHWGDGVEEAFAGSSSIFTLSLHNHAPGFFPSPPQLHDECDEAQTRREHSQHRFNVPLHPGLGDTTWTKVWRESVMPVIEALRPAAIVVQCGLDGLALDPVNQWNLGLRSILSSVSDVLAWARQENGGKPGCRPKVLLLGGGGYNSLNAAKGWAAITALALAADEPRSSSPSGKAATIVSHQSGLAQVEDLSKNILQDVLEIPIPLSHPRWPDFDSATNSEDEIITLDIKATAQADMLNDEKYLAKIHAASDKACRALSNTWKRRQKVS